MPLGQIGDPRAVEPLIDLLEKESESDILWSAATALGKIDDDRALDSLLGIVRGNYGLRARLGAAGALIFIIGNKKNPEFLYSELAQASALAHIQNLIGN